MAKDEHREPADFDETSESSHAADEPTAVWDMEALRKAGLGELANLPEGPDSAPATPAAGMAQRPSMIVDEPSGAPAAPATPAAARQEPAISAPKAQGSGAGGWLGLVTMALVLAAAAYLAIRFLR